jgi:hypothetical protein
MLKIPEGTPVKDKDIEAWAKGKDGLLQILKTENAEEQAATTKGRRYDIDWDYLKKLYGVKTGDSQSRIINFQLISEQGPVKLPPSYAQVTFPPKEKSPLPATPLFIGHGVVVLPPKSGFHPTLRELEAHSALGADAVVVLHREVNGRPSEFVLARNWEQPPVALKDVDLTLAQQFLRYPLVFDGDVVEITTPTQLPIVASSLLAPMLKSVFDLRAGGRAQLPNPSGIGSSLLPSQFGIGSSLLPGQIGLGSSLVPNVGQGVNCVKQPGTTTGK